MSRILLTGASGFIGMQIAAALARNGHEVIALSRSGASPIAGMRGEAFDVLDHAQHARVDALKGEILIHSAWITTHGVYWTSPENALWEVATLALAKRFIAAGGKRIVGVGTCAEYEFGGDDPLDEAASPLVPHTPYGQAKLRTWAALDALAREAGIEAAWCRLFHLYGVGEGRGRLVPSVILPLLAGEEARTTPGTQIRDFMSSYEAGRAIAHVAGSNATGPINIGSGQAMRIAELVMMIAELMGCKHLLKLGALPFRADDPAVIIPRLDRLNKTGFTMSTDLATGLEDTIAYWKNECRI